MNWYTKSKVDDLQGLVIEEETGRNVAVTYDSKDAVLVAAAPELLNSLKEIMENILYSGVWTHYLSVWPNKGGAQ